MNLILILKNMKEAPFDDSRRSVYFSDESNSDEYVGSEVLGLNMEMVKKILLYMILRVKKR